MASKTRRFTLSINGTNLRVSQAGVDPVDTALAGAVTQTVNLFTLAGGERIKSVKAKATTAFTGGATTACRAQVGVAGDLDRYLALFNVRQAVADSAAARCLQESGSGAIASIQSALPDATAATAAVPVPATVTGAAVGDKVLGLVGVYGPAAGFTEAGSTGAAAVPIEVGTHIEPVVSVINQVQFVAAPSVPNLTPYTGTFLLRRGGGLESDAAAGTVIQATLVTVAANLSALTAGAVDLFIETDRAPLATLGIG